MKDDTGHRPQRALKDEERIIRRLGTEMGLSKDEATCYPKLIRNASVEDSTERELAEGLNRGGMVTLPGDDK